MHVSNVMQEDFPYYPHSHDWGWISFYLKEENALDVILEVTNFRLFLSPRTSIGFHKILKITSIEFNKKSFLKEFSPMGSLSKQMRPTADFLL